MELQRWKYLSLLRLPPVSVLLRSLLWQILAGNCQTLEGFFPTRWLHILKYIRVC